MAWNMTDFRNILDKYEKMYLETSDSLVKHDLAVNIASIKSEIVSEELSEFDRVLKAKQEEEEAKRGFVDRIAKRIKAGKPIHLNVAASYGSIVYDISSAALFKEVYPYIEDFHRSVKFIKDTAVRDGGSESKYKLSDEEILDLTHDLFKSTTKRVYDIYSILEKKRHESIRLNPKKPSGYGAHFWFPYVEDRFLEVGTDGDSEETLGVLGHEVGHFIGSVVNEDRYVNNDSYSEIESLFFELVAYDYYGKRLYKGYYRDSMKNLFDGYVKDANGILITRNVTDEFFNNFTKVKNPYEYYAALLNSNSGFCHIDLAKNINYTFSFIAAVELFEIYKEDKDLAIDLLFRIMSENRRKSEVAKITDNVDLNTHIDNHIKRLYLGRGGSHGLVQ